MEWNWNQYDASEVCLHVCEEHGKSGHLGATCWIERANARKLESEDSKRRGEI